RGARIRSDPSGSGAGPGVFATGAGGGWELVWTLGRQLRVRDLVGPGRFANDRRGHVRTLRSPGGGLAGVQTEFGRRMGGIVLVLYRSRRGREGRQYALPDRLGTARLPLGRGMGFHQRGAWGERSEERRVGKECRSGWSA